MASSQSTQKDIAADVKIEDAQQMDDSRNNGVESTDDHKTLQTEAISYCNCGLSGREGTVRICWACDGDN